MDCGAYFYIYFYIYGKKGGIQWGEQPITWGGESTKSPPLPPIIFISSDINIANHMSQSEDGSSNRKRTLIISDSIMTNIEWWRLDKRMKSNVAVKLNRDQQQRVWNVMSEDVWKEIP